VATTSSSTTTTAVTTTTTTTAPPIEICDNCLDDDGDGFVDLEDSDCCSSASGALLELRKGSFRALDGGVARMRLKARLSQHGLADSATSTQDVSVQIRSATGEVLCARMPAQTMGRKKTKLVFKDKTGVVTPAQGVSKLVLRARKDGTGRLSTTGKHTVLVVPVPGPLDITLGLRDPATAEAGNLCATGTATFRATKNTLRFP
jgi:hypothetical protein